MRVCVCVRPCVCVRARARQGGDGMRCKVVGCGLWVVGCGLWVVGCGLWFEVGCRGLRFGVCLLNDDGNILLMSHSLRYCTVMFLYLKRRGQDKGLGFGVCGLGFGVCGLWFVVWGLGFGV